MAAQSTDRSAQAAVCTCLTSQLCLVDNHTQKQAGSAIRIKEKNFGVIKEMRILLGTLLGYSLRQRERLLITILTFVLITIYIVLPTLSLAIQAIALTHLGLSVHRERLARPKQTRVPAIKGLDYQSAVTILRGSHLNIRVLATRYDLPQQPGTIVDQSPAPGEQVDYNYAVGVTITDTASPRATYTCKFSSVALSSPSVPRTLTLSSGSSSNRHSSTQPMRKKRRLTSR